MTGEEAEGSLAAYLRRPTARSNEACESVKRFVVWPLPHFLCGVDVASLVELILERRHHGVVPRDPVYSCVLQTHVLHQAAADLHDQRDELSGKHGQSSAGAAALSPHSGMADVMSGLTLFITPGWQSSSRTPKALGPAFFVFFMMLIPHGDFGGALSSRDEKPHCLHLGLSCPHI